MWFSKGGATVCPGDNHLSCPIRGVCRAMASQIPAGGTAAKTRTAVREDGLCGLTQGGKIQDPGFQDTETA